MAENTLYLDWARDVLNTEAEGLHEIAAALDDNFVRAAEALLHCKGRVVIAGMGKSGHIGRKMAATMASTGTPAFFVHPAEAAHGDLGMIVDNDVVVAISNSGESDEIAAIIPALKRKNITFVCITARPDSTMARHADIHITASVSKEACPLGLAPTTSTTAVMALGDALAVVLLRARAFTPDDFALSHPAGSLGKRLLLRVADIMHKGGGLPAVRLGTPLKEAIVSMSEKGLGMLAVTDGQCRLKGVFTDGDLRRLFQECDNFTGLSIDEVMHTHPKTISAERLATEALKVMQANHVNGLLVTDADGVLIGALNMHDLLAARIV
ncbi:KpsF/GutQ family sugar-phosphate isomerase [Neisseria meningitidis]|uniref:KpsF/GutQ family sugar-phosphate isomerase n=1 Tax=Neisseria meningitidis TaxID=487 RepID=UPI00032DAA3E|nr:KpsF/GutQ family sugar-phosphate isomerase [Neisseria meningitidis]EOC14833.1 arabinose 5-phosphate isomerase KdsD [Neisseria meningitidis 73696]MBW3877694.1 KpsF/GutQ family sugar-phosphate isomerase [Neisseria meningitidis]MBW3886205.1 KpsF/GutQ family sugar-phosphate isomerase [Neisseria meningitidis]MBW3902106.1 KpsF/GutQ family sugar-phosphate isomerase [Neisseria meningitidis]MBW3908163.1 KpsF/GutQ family sugar-phosphate isomerase [Neisseria meningitidis]